ncbi:hypothetical protein ABFV83_12370 [Lacrimispora sp. BS-2]|uniref:Uncharacterized protein n=1 Tax=Lacrimispora sp. BS-2 TaxID=3151850 RepID=A0AAU7PK20_9FIRM
MKKTVIIVILILLAVMIIVFYTLNTLNLAESAKKRTYDEIIERLTEEKQASDKALAELQVEQQKSDKDKDILKSQLCKNAAYEMFYGEWEVTDHIYVDPTPFRGIHYSEYEVEEQKASILKGISTKTIQFTQKNIVINGNEMIENIRYKYSIFPATDNYHLHFEMTLKDIGLTKAEGNYFVYVEVETASDESFGVSSFFVKDENTLIVYRGHYCVEYTRISYDGGSEEPVIISG